MITSVDNPMVKLAAKLVSSKKARTEQGLFVIEGFRLCLDAIESGVVCRQVFLTADANVKYDDKLELFTAAGAQFYELADSVFAKVSDTKTPQGILCVCEMLDKKAELDKIDTNGMFIGLEHIQDPGNLGTIIRTAEAVGISGLILSEDCCDIFNPKVIRATMGGVFRMPIYETQDICVVCEKFNEAGLDTYAAVLDETARGVTETLFKKGSAVFIGNEGSGLSNELLNLCGQTLTIKMSGRAESLNAAMAAGIIMWEMVRR